MRVGIPRVLNLYSTAPFFRTYFETLGLQKQNIVFSDVTSEGMWQEGAKYGSVDPCFPSKVAQAHVHNLLFSHHDPAGKRLEVIFFPSLTHVPNFVTDTVDDASCPIVAGTPNVLKAAFTKEVDFFAQRGTRYLDPALSFAEPLLLARGMFEALGALLEVTEDESDHACRQGLLALAAFDADLQRRGRAVLDTVEAENRIALLVLSRPYHGDPGLNHGIPEEFQALGYPILSIRSIPKDRTYLERYFQQSPAQSDPLALSGVWPENYSANSAQKVWGATFAARHPNVAVLDLSSFKCGHDAPTYGLIDTILQTARTPTAALHDIDANKPGGSIKIRVKTYAHSLRLHQERVEDEAARRQELSHRVAVKELELLERARANTKDLSELDAARLGESIEALRQRVASYHPRRGPEQETGLVRLGRRRADGTVERFGANTTIAAE